MRLIQLGKWWRSISPAQAVVLVAILASITATIIAAPERFWVKLSETDPLLLAAWITTVGAAIVGVFTQSRGGR